MTLAEITRATFQELGHPFVVASGAEVFSMSGDPIMGVLLANLV